MSRSYEICAELSETFAGYYLYLYRDDELISRTPYRDKQGANDAGLDWVELETVDVDGV